jgi:hypothetical protein
MTSKQKSTEEELQDLTFDDIYNNVVAHDEVFLDYLDADEIVNIRKGLSDYKSKINARLKKQELPTEDRTLEYETVHVYKNDSIKLRIYFGQPKVIKAKLIPGDGSLV